MLSVLHRLGLGTEFVWQVKMPFWDGLLDFYYPERCVVVQVDGPHHLASEEGVPRDKRQYTTDARMIMHGLTATVGQVIVRVHHCDLARRPEAVAAAVRCAMQVLDAPALILTESFAAEAPFPGYRDPWAFFDGLIDLMLAIDMSFAMPEHDECGNMIFKPQLGASCGIPSPLTL